MNEQWIYEQFSTIDVGDTRLQKRAVDVAIGCAERPEESLAGRFDEWADLQGAYVFLVIPKLHIRRFNNPITIKCWKRHAVQKSSSYLFKMAQSFCSIPIHGHMDLGQPRTVTEMDSCFTRA